MDILLQRRIYFTKRELAHLAANVLLLFASVWGCSLISGESLKTLKSTGRGKGVRGRWRNWRNNATIRGEIWRILPTSWASAFARRAPLPPRIPARAAANLPTPTVLRKCRNFVQPLSCTAGKLRAILPLCLERGDSALPILLNPPRLRPFFRVEGVYSNWRTV